MTLPGVNIKLSSGQLGRSATSDDSIAGLILTGVTVSGTGKVTAGKAYNIFSLKEATNLGIEATGTNSYAYSQIKAFYDAAGTGSELWFMLAAKDNTATVAETDTVTMEDMLDKTKVDDDKLYAPKLLNAAKGKIRKLGVSRESASGITISGGLDADVDKALVKGQALAEEYATNFKPFRFLVDGKEFNGTVSDLKDYRSTSFNRGAVLLGATSASKNASVGFAVGYMASLPVQRKISRVKNGALPISEAYMTNTKATEDFENAWNSIHDKGYIFFRTFTGKSGYYFNDDPTATSSTDDYGSLSRGFVIDKALTIAYQTYVEEIADEIEVDSDGKLNPAQVKDLQGKVETAIELQMIANQEASDVQAIIDPTQNVISTDKLKITLRVRPVGYTNFIDVVLGFENPSSN